MLLTKFIVDENEDMGSQEDWNGREVQFKYSLRHTIGLGSFGTVWKSVDSNDTLDLAVKRMKLTDEMIISQINNEIEANESLQHENIGTYTYRRR